MHGHPVPVVSAERQPGSVMQQDAVVAAEHRAQLFDTLNVDNGGTVDAEKLVRIKDCLHIAHRLTNKI